MSPEEPQPRPPSRPPYPLDRESLDRWHRHYIDHGPMDHFHAPEHPGRYRRLPLN